MGNLAGLKNGLLKHPDWVHQTVRYGEAEYTPLQLAVRVNQNAIADELIKAGAVLYDPNETNVYMQPIGMAIRQRQLEMVEHLLKAGALMPDKELQWGVLQAAIVYSSFSDIRIFEMLVNHGVDIYESHEDYKGDLNALNIAAAVENEAIAAYLIKKGIDPLKPNKHGISVVEMSEKNRGDRIFADFLRRISLEGLALKEYHELSQATETILRRDQPLEESSALENGTSAPNIINPLSASTRHCAKSRL